MSITCPHCGRNIESDEEIQLEAITKSPELAAVPIEVIDVLRKEIKLLDQMIKDGTPHDDRSELLTTVALHMLDIIEEDD